MADKKTTGSVVWRHCGETWRTPTIYSQSICDFYLLYICVCLHPHYGLLNNFPLAAYVWPDLSFCVCLYFPAYIIFCRPHPIVSHTLRSATVSCMYSTTFLPVMPPRYNSWHAAWACLRGFWEDGGMDWRTNYLYFSNFLPPASLRHTTTNHPQPFCLLCFCLLCSSNLLHV